MEKNVTLALVCLLTCTLVVSCSGTATPARDSTVASIRGGYIVFVSSDRDGKGSSGIYVMRADGSEVRRLTNHPSDRRPSWSPDGRHIVFESSRHHGGGREIYVMEADGSEVKRLTEHSANDTCPVWLPDGKHIAFMSDRDHDDKSPIYVMEADGSEVKRLKNHTRGTEVFSCPSWSLDGKYIAFVSRVPGGCWVGKAEGKAYDSCEGEELLVMKANGRGLTRLTHWKHSFGKSGGLYHPSWSPEGKRIAFANEKGEIYVVNADGSEVTKLTHGYYPTWSPDGKRIAFMCKRNGNWEICVMNADGTEVANLTNLSAYDGFPSWSP